MFWTYLRRELRKRAKQATVVAVGLAIGIGLVMTVSAAAAGVKSAQGKVLHSLYGVGTDMTVTKTATFGSGGPQRFGGFGSRPGAATTRPAAGTHFSRNTLRPTPGDGVIKASAVQKTASLKGVAAASGGLSLTDTSFSGTIPNFNSSGSGAGGGGSGGFSSSFSISSFSVDGVAISRSAVGPLDSASVTKGRYFTSGENDSDVAILSSSYAGQHGLKVGSDITVAGKKLTVVGLSSADAANVYVPLGTAQQLAGLKDDVTIVYVSAKSSTSVSSITAAVKKAVPGATVTTSASLAKEVSGSLQSASSLASNLGKWLSIAALLVAFLVAGLLMAAAVSRRVREFGTLKAIGWRSRRVVGQVMGEGLALGVLGGVLGIALGIAGTEIVSAVSPALTATVGSSFATSGGAGGFGGAAGGGFGGGGFRPGGFAGRSNTGAAARALDAAHTVLVHLTAPLQGGTIGLAVLLAIAGGLVAGAFGSWRAARLSPAAALRRVE